MGQEIERKFLVRGDEWRKLATPQAYRQGYLSTVSERTVRVRAVGNKGFLTIKGTSRGVSRSEFEYEIPIKDANEMLDRLCERPLIEKRRSKIPIGKHTWEVDEFLGDNKGLIVAEIELSNEKETFEKPRWIGDEVSSDSRYYNANLARNPYKSWKNDSE